MKINLFYRFFPVWAVIWGIMSGCAKNETEDVQLEGIPVNVACRLQVSSFEGEKPTRAGGGLMNGELSANEETKISDLTVIQFDGTGDEAQVVIIRTFVNPDLTKVLEIGFMQPLDESTKEQTIYFIANTGGVFDNYAGTLGKLKSDPFSLSETDIRDGKMVMTGSLVTAIHAEIEQKITLTRRLAKIVFNIDTSGLPGGSEFNPVWLQLQSIPSVSCLFPATGTDATTPEANADLYTNSAPVIDKVLDGYVWYIPENKRGTNMNNAGEANKNENAPAYSTCVYLEGDYYPTKDNTADAKKVYYKLYPGKDIISDFNIEGNKVYNVTLKITGMDNAANDKRIDVIDMPDPLPGANCYMVVPGNTLTFNPYAAPGVDVSQTGISYNGRLGSDKDNSKIHHIGIVWQTEIGLIKELYYLVNSGEIRLVTDNKIGNALIAAYDADNRILWSWHIWVTEYILGNVNDNMSDNSAAATPEGNVYKWEGYIWMDRSIGALSAKLGVKSYGMIFQWGRKDPFTPASAVGSNVEGIPIYDVNGNKVYPSGKSYNTFTNYLFNEAMNNPTMFYSFTSEGISDWYGTPGHLQLWDYPNKTCFDPCPAGWCMPPVDAIKNISKSSGKTTIVYDKNSNQQNNRVYANNLPDLFWSYLGIREQYTGLVDAAGVTGIFWTAGYHTNNLPRIYGGFEAQYNTYKKGDGETTHIYRNSKDGLGGRCVKISSSN